MNDKYTPERVWYHNCIFVCVFYLLNVFMRFKKIILTIHSSSPSSTRLSFNVSVIELDVREFVYKNVYKNSSINLVITLDSVYNYLNLNTVT